MSSGQINCLRKQAKYETNVKCEELDIATGFIRAGMENAHQKNGSIGLLSGFRVRLGCCFFGESFLSVHTTTAAKHSTTFQISQEIQGPMMAGQT